MERSDERAVQPADDEADDRERTCPACGAPTRQEKCKIVCRSERCTYRIVYNCAEF